MMPSTWDFVRWLWRPFLVQLAGLALVAVLVLGGFVAFGAVARAAGYDAGRAAKLERKDFPKGTFAHIRIPSERRSWVWAAQRWDSSTVAWAEVDGTCWVDGGGYAKETPGPLCDALVRAYAPQAMGLAP